MPPGPKNEKKKKKSSIMALSKEFADSTSMHGLRFISRDDASLPERCAHGRITSLL